MLAAEGHFLLSHTPSLAGRLSKIGGLERENIFKGGALRRFFLSTWVI